MSNTNANRAIMDSLFFNHIDVVLKVLAQMGIVPNELGYISHKGMQVCTETEQIVDEDFNDISWADFFNAIKPNAFEFAKRSIQAHIQKTETQQRRVIAEENDGVVINTGNGASVVAMPAQAPAPTTNNNNNNVVFLEADFDGHSDEEDYMLREAGNIRFAEKLTLLNAKIAKPTWPGGYKVNKATKDDAEVSITPIPNFQNFTYMLGQYGLRPRHNMLTISVDCELAPHIKLTPSDRKTLAEGKATGVKAIIHDICIMNGFKCNEQLLNSHLFRVTTSHQFNPIFEYLDTLPEWDGVDYIGMCVDALPSPDHFDRAWGRELFTRHLVSWVAMSYKPGFARPSSTFIITGGQGKGKSNFVSQLFPKTIRGVFKDGVTMDLNNKDSILQIIKHGAVELAEIDHSLNKSNVEAFKQFNTANSTEIRVPYAAEAIEVPRFTLLFGTSNDKDFLTDYSGTRRFWVWDVGPNKVGGSIKNLPAEFNVDGLWAQVLALYNDGTPHWLNEEEQARNEVANIQFSGYNNIRDSILTVFQKALDSNLRPITSVSTVEMDTKTLANLCDVDLTRHSKEFSRQLRSIFGDPRKSSVMKYRVPDLSKLPDSFDLDLE